MSRVARAGPIIGGAGGGLAGGLTIQTSPPMSSSAAWDLLCGINIGADPGDATWIEATLGPGGGVHINRDDAGWLDVAHNYHVIIPPGWAGYYLVQAYNPTTGPLTYELGPGGVTTGLRAAGYARLALCIHDVRVWVWSLPRS